MLKKRYILFNKLPHNNKVMLFLRWTTKMRNIVLNVFINIYTISIHNDISLLIVSNIIYFIASHSGYALNWIRLRFHPQSIKHNFIISYVLFIVSFIYLYFVKDYSRWIMSFYLVFWFWNWLYYFTTIYFEAGHLPEKMRDFYASTLKAWDNIVKIIIPALISLIFYLAMSGITSWYDILLLLAPAPFIIALVLISKINITQIPKIDTSIWIKEYLFPKDIPIRKIYFYMLFWVQRTLVILFSIFLLNTLINEINIWLYEALFSLVSIWLLIIYSINTNAGNRNYLMRSSYIVVWLAIAWLGVFQDPIYLVMYSIIMIGLEPIAWSIMFAYYYDILDVLLKHPNIKYKHQWIIWTDFWVNFARIWFLVFILLLIKLVWSSTAIIIWFFLLWILKAIHPFVINLNTQKNN